MSNVAFGAIGGAAVGLLFTITVGILSGLKYLREIRDLLKERQGD